LKTVSEQIQVDFVVPEGQAAKWLADLIDELRELDHVALSVRTVRDPISNHFNLSRRLFTFWKLLDYRVFKGRESWSSNSEQLIDVKSDGIVCLDRSSDVIVWLANVRPPARLFSNAKFGIWTMPNATKVNVGFVEHVKKIPVISCELVSLGASPSNDVALTAAFVATEKLSISASLAVVRARDRGNLLTMLRRVHLEGNQGQARTTSLLAAGPVTHAPSLVALTIGLARIYCRYLCDVIQRSFHIKQWQLAIRFGGERLDSKNLVRVKPDHKGFWADPFVIRREDRTVVFFEEMPAEGDRGEILCFEIHRDGTFGEVQSVLKRDYHLSYPFLFEYEGNLFMTPECADAGKIEAFRCTSFPNKWESHAVLMDGIRAFDPTLVEHNGKWWLFATIQGHGNSPNDELHLYYADHPFGNWIPHRLNPVNVDVRRARPAGALFKQGDALYRPAQDCSVRYGYALSVNKILAMSENEYIEEEVHRILPESPDSLGTHTVNQAAGITIYDCFVKRPSIGSASPS